MYLSLGKRFKMVNKERFKTTMFLFMVVFSSHICAQNVPEYKGLQQYRNWGVTMAAALYDKAELSQQYGAQDFKNFKTVSFNAGFEYDFYPEKAWSFQTGLFIGYEPAYNIEYTIAKEDVITPLDDDEQKAKAFGTYSFSIPLYFSLQKKVGKNIYAYVKTGLRYMRYTYGSASFSAFYTSEDGSEVHENFGLRLKTQEFENYGSWIIGVGTSFAAKNFLLKTNLLYVMNFQPIMFGEYQFANLEVSEPTRGDYTLSGNYFALSFTIHFNKPKDKWE